MEQVKQAAGVLAAFTAILTAMTLLLRVINKTQNSTVDKLKE